MISRSYAEALYGALEDAQESESSFDVAFDQLRDTLEQTRHLFRQAPWILRIAQAPYLQVEERAQVVEILAQSLGWSGLLVRFFTILGRHRRLLLVDQILNGLDQIRLRRRGEIGAAVVSAVALSAEEVQNLERVLLEVEGQPVRLTQSVDPELLAGVQVTVHGLTLDGSLRGRFNRLSESLKFSEMPTPLGISSPV